MNIEPFYLERWLLNPNKYDLASAGITKLKLCDLVDSIDINMIMSYGETRGSEALRNEIADLYNNVDKDNVLVTTGTAEANLLSLLQLIEPGDELVTFTPTYMQCIGIARRLGAIIKTADFIEKSNHQPDIEKLTKLVTDKTKVILLVNPNNPTGSVLTNEEMRLICNIAKSVNAWVLCDGALRGLEITGHLASNPLDFYDKGIATGSISKIGLTGPRIGWLVADQKFVDGCWQYKDYTTLSHSGIGEYLATIALHPDNISRFRIRARAIIKTHLAILSDWVTKNYPVIEWNQPIAGHTAFIKYNLNVDAITLAKELLTEEDVLIGPGEYFGSQKHFRLRYSCEENILIEGLHRLGTFLKRVY